MRILITLILNIADWLGFSLATLWSYVREYLGTKWAVLILIVGAVWLLIDNATAVGTYLATVVAGFVFARFNLAIPTQAVTVAAICNTFFPLVELCLLLVEYALFSAGMALYYHIKSMIPSPFPGGGGT